LPQAYLGIAFGWAVPMSFAAQTDSIPAVAWVMYLAVILWALVYDTMYAMVDKEDDLKIGVKSTAILFGDKDREIMAVLQLIIMGLLLKIGMMQDLSAIYFVSIILASGFFIYEQTLIFHRHKSDCFKAFLNSNYFGLTVFVGLLLEYL